MSTILDEIVVAKRKEIAQLKTSASAAELQQAARDASPPRDFFGAINNEPRISLIAEVKKASPSAGIIRADFDPVAIARSYEGSGATCVSVLTDSQYFQGNIEYLKDVRAAVSIPVLMKDFVLDRAQVWAGRAAGADAVLLIAECLDDCSLRSLHNEIVDLGMTPLVEFYEPANLPRVVEAGASLIGVNNRNLHTFETDLQHSMQMASRIPDQALLVSESGIRTAADVKALQQSGAAAILVGEQLMRSPDIGAAVARLLHEVM